MPEYPKDISQWATFAENFRIEYIKAKTHWANLDQKAARVITELADVIEHHDKWHAPNGLGDGTGQVRKMIDELVDAQVRLLDIFGSLDIHVQEELEHAFDKLRRRVPKHGKRFL